MMQPPKPHVQSYKKFTPDEHKVWGQLFTNQSKLRDVQIYDIFSKGVKALGMTAEHIPDIDEVNRRLGKLTGFSGIPVEGLEEDRSFYYMMMHRQFPIGNFIRDAKDLSYTPAPDVFHDLYGHMPFFADKAYADFCQDLGRRAYLVSENPEALKQWARLFWFTAEFAVITTPVGRRIFGAGIASSHGECRFALSDEPEVLKFDPEVIRNRPYKIDEFQKTIFLLDSPEQLYRCLPDYDRRVREAVGLPLAG